jgi:hypothetical protein
MRWFIVQLRAEKLQYFAYPNVLDAWTDTNSVAVYINLPQSIVNLAAVLIAKTHVEFCIGVAKQIHVFWTCAVCKLSDDHPQEDPRLQPQDPHHPEEDPQ